ncbi:hypothetical protein [Vibrio sp. B1Z05]|uniref:hypothetical protein n=1 Tax=Vibrio sp. B1Z05 TaxID=2654980 RepID=UPI00128BA4C5|nr:hypothetical protein [Vibrio sp. B1Z05]MPW36497.1 hypothetical protein [Vibrio sp. B1Z05]
MAAEKLTKGRLIQIIVTFSVLIIAFTWRTFTHDQSNAINKVECNTQEICQISLNKKEYQLDLDVKNSRFRLITNGNDENKGFVEFKGATYQISEFIAVDSLNNFDFSIRNGQHSINVNVK